VGRLRDALGIRPIDLAAFLAVLAAVEITVATGGGPGAHPLNAVAYVAGGVLVIPVLLRHKWPLQVLIACSVLLLLYYWFDRRNITPAPLLSLPLYDAAAAGFLAVAVVIPAFYMSVGLFVVEASTHASLLGLASEFLLSIVVLALAVVLGDTVRSRRALAAETADKLRLAAEEREAEAAARVAQERLRIARELHDTVAHSMATITVQAGSALHLIDEGLPAAIRDALVAIRDTSKGALTDMRVTLGQLRGSGADVDGAETRTAGLDRLDSLSEAVRAAGAPVSVAIEGERIPLPPGVDHAAYRILQESLTNVLRHAGPDASAAVCLRYAPGSLTIRVTDDGTGGSGGSSGGGGANGAGEGGGGDGGSGGGSGHGLTGGDGGGSGHGLTGGDGGGSGHGLTGMTERAAAVGGELSAGPRPEGGFEVLARLPVAGASPAARPAPAP
jgi:signal transduction histidine kinase